MKVNIKITCSPEEARSFFGLPDVQPLQEAMMAEMEERMRASMSQFNPDEVLKSWMGAGSGLEQMQEAFWGALKGGGSGDVSKD